MAQILNRFDVVKALKQIIDDAENEMILISPYIKLNNQLKDALQKHKHKKDFSLTIVYGKNEEDSRLSLSESDLDFFKDFQNVEVRYHRRLHAKLYANDFDCLITSMNLHTYSINENIEVGVLLKMNLWKDLGSVLSSNISNSLEGQARDFAGYVIGKSEVQFGRRINKRKHFFGLLTSYSDPVIEKDKKRTGFCIRTKALIPYNPSQPYCNAAYIMWLKWKDKNYREKYCHGCGIEMATSMAKPLCRDCWSKGN